ncbi:MAG: hypothetical protein ABIO67_00215 [Mycobacteriales bacterium]
MSVPTAGAGTTGRIACVTCAAPYLPSLTGWACPVCDTEAPSAAGRRRLRLSPDDRLLGIVIVASILNVLLLGILAALALNA